MHIHSVYFWLKDDLENASRAQFEQGLAALCVDTAVSRGYFGVPAVSERAVVDSSYSYGLVLIFEDTARHDQYQVGAVHDDFLAKNAAKWTRIQVYDVITS
jgi:hypothetical protein